jgi:hypothetical protein
MLTKNKLFQSFLNFKNFLWFGKFSLRNWQTSWELAASGILYSISHLLPTLRVENNSLTPS